MAQFLRKAVAVEAWQWEPADKALVIPQWLQDHRSAGYVHTVQDAGTVLVHLEVHTGGAWVRVDPGDWIVRDAAGDIDVVEAEVFVDAYEAADV